MTLFARCATSLAVALLFTFAAFSAATVSPVQKAALVDLYKSTNGPKWCDAPIWNIGTDPCDDAWAGVYCDGSNTTVTSLNLGSQCLTGTLPSSLGDLTGLRYLQLGYNKLHGSLPDSLGNLAQLGQLYIAQSGLQGTLPASIGDLSQLWYIDFTGNRLTGSIPASFGALSLLQTLYLYDNQLSGTIPGELRRLTALKDLDFSQNQLSGTIPSGFSVPTFDVSFNKLTGPMPDFVVYKELTYTIMLQNNTLSGPASSGVTSLLADCGLYELDVAGNDALLSDKGFSALCNGYTDACRAKNPNFVGYCYTYPVPDAE